MSKATRKYLRPRVRILDARSEHMLLQSSGNTVINHGYRTNPATPVSIQAYQDDGTTNITFNY